MHTNPLVMLMTRHELRRLALASGQMEPRVTDADISAALAEAEHLVQRRRGQALEYRRRQGKPVRYAVEPSFSMKQVHPDFRPDGVAPRVGRALQHLTRTVDTDSPAHELAFGLLQFGPDHQRFTNLGEALHADGHQMAQAYNWGGMHDGIEMDRHVTAALLSDQIPLRTPLDMNPPGFQQRAYELSARHDLDPEPVHPFVRDCVLRDLANHALRVHTELMGPDAAERRRFRDSLSRISQHALDRVQELHDEYWTRMAQTWAPDPERVDAEREAFRQRREHEAIHGPFSQSSGLRYQRDAARRFRPIRYADDDDDRQRVARAPRVQATEALQRVGATRKWTNAAAKLPETARPPLDPALYRILEHIHKTAPAGSTGKNIKRMAAHAILGMQRENRGLGEMPLADHRTPPSNYDPYSPERIPVESTDVYARLGSYLQAHNHPMANALNWHRVGRGVVLDHMVEDYLAKNGIDPKKAHRLVLNKGNTQTNAQYRAANPNFYETLPHQRFNDQQQRFIKAFTQAAQDHVPTATIHDVGRAFVRAAMRAHTPYGPGIASTKPADARQADPQPMSQGHLRRYRRVQSLQPDNRNNISHIVKSNS